MRADLRLADLSRGPIPSKLMNVQIPARVSDAIDRVARDLGCSKTAAVVALLNEGLDAAHDRLNVDRNPIRRSAAPARRGPGRRRRAKK
jgi:hypothetical protein